VEHRGAVGLAVREGLGSPPAIVISVESIGD
jgi:hypothetical protein